MNETPESEATNPDSEASKSNEEDISLNVDELQGNELVREVYKDLDRRLKDIEAQLQDKEVTVQKKGSKILEKYPTRKKKKLLAKVFNTGSDGLHRDWIEKEFEVDEDQARKIMKKAGQQYDYLEWHYPGGPIAGKLFHVVSREAEELADILGIQEQQDEMGGTKSSRQVVLDRVDWCGDFESTEVLQELRHNREEVEAEKKQKESYNEAKKRVGSIF